MLPSPHPPAPAPAADIGLAPGRTVEDFRCSDARAVHALLCELRDTAGPVVLGSADGSVLRATLWTVDLARRRVSFDVEATDPALPSLVVADECTAMAWLNAVRLQFDLGGLMLVHGPRGTALQATMPAELYRFQRRDAFRVALHASQATSVELRHPAIPDIRLSLRVLDLSTTGCALQLPPDMPPLPLGIELHGVLLELDARTTLPVMMRTLHASSAGAQADGVRVGCEFLSLEPDTRRALQRHVDQLQRQRRLLALD